LFKWIEKNPKILFARGLSSHTDIAIALSKSHLFFFFFFFIFFFFIIIIFFFFFFFFSSVLQFLVFLLSDRLDGAFTHTIFTFIIHPFTFLHLKHSSFPCKTQSFRQTQLHPAKVPVLGKKFELGPITIAAWKTEI